MLGTPSNVEFFDKLFDGRVLSKRTSVEAKLSGNLLAD